MHQAKWGTHALIEAARHLFKEALGNPFNQRFVILSESGIPLYPPTLIWQQFMSETKSRINACQHPGEHVDANPLDPSNRCLGNVKRLISIQVPLNSH